MLRAHFEKIQPRVFFFFFGTPLVFARPKSVRPPLLPDLSLILSSSIPFSPHLKPISDTWTAHYPSRNPSHAIGATTVCLSHLISLEWPAWSRLASSSTYLTSYRGSTAPLSLQSILSMTFAIGIMMMFSFPVRSGGRTPAILTIAGSDSGGSAGIQVYLEFGPPYGSLSADSSWYMVLQAGRSENIHSFRLLWGLCHENTDGTNTKGIQAVHIIPPSFVEEQVSFCHCASLCYQGVLPSV